MGRAAGEVTEPVHQIIAKVFDPWHMDHIDGKADGSEELKRPGGKEIRQGSGLPQVHRAQEQEGAGNMQKHGNTVIPGIQHHEMAVETFGFYIGRIAAQPQSGKQKQ